MDTYYIDDEGNSHQGLPPEAVYTQIGDYEFGDVYTPEGKVATVDMIPANGGATMTNIAKDQVWLIPDGNGGYRAANPLEVAYHTTYNPLVGQAIAGRGLPELSWTEPGSTYGGELTVAVNPATGQPYDLKLTTTTDIPPGDNVVPLITGGGAVSGGGGGGGGGGYTTSTTDNTGYSGPQVMYADGWIPPFFGGKYTRSQWLAMQYPDNGSSGPAQLPELPKSFNLDVFGGSTPGNPFTSGEYGGGYGGYGGYGQSSAPDPSQLPLAKRLYQKFSNMRQQVTPGAPPTQSEYDQAQRQQQRDYRRNENEYQKYQASLTMRSNPLMGLERYIGQDRYQGPEYDLYSDMPLTGLQYLLNSKAKAKQFDDPKKYQKQLQQMYRQIDQSSEGWNYDKMMKGIWGGGKNSAVASLFQQRGTPEARYDSNGMYTGMSKGRATGADPTSQMYAMNNLLNGVYQTTMDPATAATWAAYADRQMAHWANRQYRKNPNNYGDIRKYMRGRVL